MHVFTEESMATSVRLDPESEARLDTLSRTTGRTKAFYLRELIKRGLEDLEDYYLGLEVRERIRKGEETTVESKQVRDEFGVED